MSDWNGTVKITWRLGVLVAIIGTVVGGAFWAGRFTSRVDDMTVTITALSSYSHGMGVKVDRLREHQVADVVGDKSVERRLARIEGVLVRIEDLIREKYRRDNE